MKLDVEKAVKFPFEDPEWLKRFGIYVAVAVAISILGSVLNLFTGPLTSVFRSIEGTGVDVDLDSIMKMILPYFSLTAISVLTFPVQLYLSGYVFQITANVMDGDEHPSPDHNDFGLKFKLWWAKFVATFVPTMIVTFVVGLLAFPTVLLSIYVLSTEPGAAGIILIGFLWMVVLLIILAISFYTSFVVIPGMEYLYLKNDDFSEMFNLTLIAEFGKLAWKKVVLVAFIMIALAMVGSFIPLILCFISFLVSPVINSMIEFSKAHLYGQIYRSVWEETGGVKPQTSPIIETSSQPVTAQNDQVATPPQTKAVVGSDAQASTTPTEKEV